MTFLKEFNRERIKWILTIIHHNNQKIGIMNHSLDFDFPSNGWFGLRQHSKHYRQKDKIPFDHRRHFKLDPRGKPSTLNLKGLLGLRSLAPRILLMRSSCEISPSSYARKIHFSLQIITAKHSLLRLSIIRMQLGRQILLIKRSPITRKKNKKRRIQERRKIWLM